jgi:antirestriction protein ArdC
MEHFQNINTVTESVYSISNQNHLEEHKVLFQLGSDKWAGFKQWNELGRKVKKGAKGCKIFMVCDKKDKDKEGKEKKKKVLKVLYVFNKDHTEEI